MNKGEIIQRKWLLTKYEMWRNWEMRNLLCHPPIDGGIPKCHIYLFIMKMNVYETLKATKIHHIGT